MINPDTKSIIDKILNLLHKSNSILGLENKVYAVVLDNESEEYYGCNFQMNQLNFKFRKSKITPKKVGQFVTLWKRNNENQTAPFHENDNFDYYLIASEQENKLGFFLFTKIVLIEKQILSTDKKERVKEVLEFIQPGHKPIISKPKKHNHGSSNILLIFQTMKITMSKK